MPKRKLICTKPAKKRLKRCSTLEILLQTPRECKKHSQKHCKMT